MKADDKKGYQDWLEFVKNENRNSPVEHGESEIAKRKRIASLEANHEAWFKYYFSAFYTSDPAPFHLRSTRKVMSNPEWFEARPWSRELSKSGRTMMEVLKLILTGKKRNVIMASANEKLAIKLLAPYKAILENNHRIIHDYGVQRSYGTWSEAEFVTTAGVSFIAFGAGQTPRGTRQMEVRPDCIIIDDIDTDETVANPDQVNKTWDWIEKALIPTRSINTPLLIIFNGNILADPCCMLKAMQVADHYQIVNIRDDKGKSTWPQKNSEENIDRTLKLISYAAAQGEYFNNPIKKGTVFQQLNYKKLLPFKSYRYLVIYGDPSYKNTKHSDFKAVIMAGLYRDEVHILKVYCAQSSTAQMLDFYYQCLQEVGGVVPVYCYIEWPFIDDSFKVQLKEADARHKITLPLKADERKKPEKFSRIESLLEPLNRNEKLWFNANLTDSQHMKAGETQFLCLSANSRAHDDFPDAVEGCVYILFQKNIANAGQISVIPRPKNNKRA